MIARRAFQSPITGLKSDFREENEVVVVKKRTTLLVICLAFGYVCTLHTTSQFAILNTYHAWHHSNEILAAPKPHFDML